MVTVIGHRTDIVKEPPEEGSIKKVCHGCGQGLWITPLAMQEVVRNDIVFECIECMSRLTRK